jgi:flagellar FliL protein
VAKSKDEGEGKKKGKGKLIAMVVVFTLIGAFAAKTILLKPPPKTEAQIAAEKKAEEEKLAALCAAHNDMPPPKGAEDGATETTMAEEAPVLELDSITVNLADGHFLKVGLALALQPGSIIQEAKDNGLGAEATNMVIDRLSGQQMSTLLPSKARVELRRELGNATCLKYEGKVLTIYFTDFVMQ